MRQHYTPQVYLRQWCDETGRLVRYCRVGPRGAPKLRFDRKVPYEICWEHNLYSVPDGGSANGLTGDAVEALLSTEIESETITAITSAIAPQSGTLEPKLAEQLKWLMQTFVARSRSGLEATAANMTAWAMEHGPMIRKSLATLPPEMRAEFSNYLDPRMPVVASLAKLASIVSTRPQPVAGWYEKNSQIRIVQMTSVKTELEQLGMSCFPTFDEPVVEWETNHLGVVATFAVSPTVLACVVDSTAGDSNDKQLTRTHAMQSLPHRQFAICRHKATPGYWLEQARLLRPWIPQSR